MRVYPVFFLQVKVLQTWLTEQLRGVPRDLSTVSANTLKLRESSGPWTQRQGPWCAALCRLDFRLSRGVKHCSSAFEPWSFLRLDEIGGCGEGAGAHAITPACASNAWIKPAYYKCTRSTQRGDFKSILQKTEQSLSQRGPEMELCCVFIDLETWMVGELWACVWCRTRLVHIGNRLYKCY